MATKEQYLEAFARVEAGNPTREQLELTRKAARQSGSWGGMAREALKRSGKNR